MPSLTLWKTFVPLTAVKDRDAAFSAACQQARSAPLAAQASLAFANKAASVMGLKFANRLGIAAGFDKQGRLAKAAGALGFGHIELGSWTPEQCSAALLQDCPAGCTPALIGVNLQVHDHPAAEFNKRLAACLPQIATVADYLSINIYDSYSEESLQTIITRVLRVQKHQLNAKKLPLVLKLHTRPHSDYLFSIIHRLQALPLEGIAISFDLGKPVTQDALLFWQDPAAQAHACRQLEFCRRSIDTQTGLIAIGGVSQAQHYQDRLNAGADLVQLHNALVFNAVDIAYQVLR